MVKTEKPFRPLKLDPSITVTECVIDGPYRYTLGHKWADGPTIMFLMMNPSRADSDQTDHTVAKCGRLAKAWGYGSLLVGNVCAYRSTDPDQMLFAKDPVGQLNYYWLNHMAKRAEKIVVAYGNLPDEHLQSCARLAVENLVFAGHLDKLHYLQLNKKSLNPSHPLYLPSALEPRPFGSSQELINKFLTCNSLFAKLSTGL